MPENCHPPSKWLPLSLALGLGACLARWRLYGETPHPLGTDGYYYVVQLEDLTASGQLHVPDSSWVFHWLHVCAQVLGEPIGGIKVAVACLLGAAVPLCAWAGWRLGGVIGAFVLAGWAALSPTLTHLGGDFPKNAGVILPLLCLLGLLAHRPSGGERSVPHWGWGLLLGVVSFGFCGTAHRVGAVLGSLALLAWGVGWILERGGPLLRRWGPLGLVCLLPLGGLLLGFFEPFVPQLGRILPELEISLRLPAPLPYLSLRETDPLQALELGLCTPILIWALLRGGPRRLFLVLPLALCILPLWRVDSLDLGYRLSLMAPLFAAPLLGSLLGEAYPTATSSLQSLGSPRAIAALLALCVAIPFVPRRGFDPQALPPYDTYRAVIFAIPRPLPKLLIAHQGINFYYDHLTGEEAMAWAPEPELDGRSIGRVVYGVRFEDWLAYQTPGDTEGDPGVKSLGAGYHYVREDKWRGVLRAAEIEGDEAFLERALIWQNPHRVRPNWMVSGRDTSEP